MVAALRSVGIPARLISIHRWHGRQDRAGHRWVEVWIDGRWYRDDGLIGNERNIRIGGVYGNTCSAVKEVVGFRFAKRSTPNGNVIDCPGKEVLTRVSRVRCRIGADASDLAHSYRVDKVRVQVVVDAFAVKVDLGETFRAVIQRRCIQNCDSLSCRHPKQY